MLGRFCEGLGGSTETHWPSPLEGDWSNSYCEGVREVNEGGNCDGIGTDCEGESDIGGGTRLTSSFLSSPGKENSGDICVVIVVGLLRGSC